MFSKPYILYKNNVCRIIAVSDTEMIRRIVAHTQTLSNSEIVDIWVYNLKRSCCVQSILHCMGYSVSAANDLSAESRREILMHAIDTRTLTKIQVISFLEFSIHQNEGRDHFYDACSKWRSDVEFIRSYRMREQPAVRGKFTQH